MADWGTRAGGVAGSGLAHCTAAILLAMSFTVVSVDRWPIGGDVFDLHIGSRPRALFELRPVLPIASRLEALPMPEECRKGKVDHAPALVGAGLFISAEPSRRTPVLCARIGADGHVLAARVLRSSGRRAADMEVERQARSLVFTPAYRDGRAVPATVTLDVLGGSGRTANDSPVAMPPLPRL